MPHLSYCCKRWGNTYSIRLNSLVLLQKRVVRMIANVGWREHSEIFKKYRILKLLDLINYQTCILRYKANNEILQENVQHNFCKIKDVHKYSMRRKITLIHIILVQHLENLQLISQA